MQIFFCFFITFAISSLVVSMPFITILIFNAIFQSIGVFIITDLNEKYSLIKYTKKSYNVEYKKDLEKIEIFKYKYENDLE